MTRTRGIECPVEHGQRLRLWWGRILAQAGCDSWNIMDNAVVANGANLSRSPESDRPTHDSQIHAGKKLAEIRELYQSESEVRDWE